MERKSLAIEKLLTNLAVKIEMKKGGEKSVDRKSC